MVLLPVTLTTPTATAVSGTITFEETILSSGNVQTQYCLAATNKGVEFLEPVRIIEPSQSTASPTHAATNEFVGQEFEELDAVEIGFTAPQTSVTVDVGLDKAYIFSVTAHVRAYSTPAPGGTPVTTSTLALGTGPTPINQAITVTSASANIRSIEVEFLGPGGAKAAIEWIDDLSFDTVGPPCATDNLPPVVLITEPAVDGSVVHGAGGGPATMLLGFVASDGNAGTGIAIAEVEFLNSAGVVVESFTVCGDGLPPCEAAPSAVTRAFFTSAPQDATKIRVTARDFAGNPGSSERTISVVESTINLYVESLEITQGTQSWIPMNTVTRAATPPTFSYPSAPTAVPLVADRRTVVRLYPEIEGTTFRVDGVGAKLRCYTDLTYTVPCPGPPVIDPEHQPAEGMTRTIPVRPVDDLDQRRRLLGFGWTFLLPFDWVKAGTVYLEAEIDPPLATAECASCDDGANHLRVSRVQFQSVPGFDNRVFTVLMQRFVKGQSASLPSAAQVKAAAETIRDVYPVDETTVINSVRTWGFDDKISPTGGNVCSAILDKLQSSFSSELKTHDVIFVLVDSKTPGICSGLGRFNGVAVARANRLDAVAQEIAHGVQIFHAGPPPGHGSECQEIQGVRACDSDWPWPHGLIGAFGFDLWDFDVVPEDRIECDTPGACDDGVDDDGDTKIDEECVGFTDSDPPADWAADPHDYMSYGGCKIWTSPRTWIRIFNAFTNSSLPIPTATAASLAASLDEAETTSVVVRGTGDEEGGWTLEPLFELPGTEAPGLNEGGTHDEAGETLVEAVYQLEFRDAEGNVVASTPVEPTYDIVHTGNPEVDILPPPSFTTLVATPPDYATASLVTVDALLASRIRSEQAPELEILSPTADGFDPQEPVVAWAASDGDGDPLEFAVQYRTNGGEWTTLGFGLTEVELPVLADQLPGGQAQVQVIASDGVNNTIVASPVFEIVDKHPSVEVVAPNDDAMYQSRDRVVLVGTGSDLEDGLLPEGALRWVSDRDGELGRGRRVEVTTLSVGTHEVLLLGTDSAGQVAAGLVVVTVEPRPTINHQPIADAGSDVLSPVDVAAPLDGTGSSDPDGDTITHHWAVTATPTGATASLSDSTSPNPTLTVDTIGVYVVELVIHDGQLGSLSDQVVVTVTGPRGDLAVADVTAQVPPPERLLVGDTADFSYVATVAYEGLSPSADAVLTGSVAADPDLAIVPSEVSSSLTLLSGESLEIELAFSATCVQPGGQAARLTATVAGADPAFIDTEPTNDTLALAFEVDCVLPVAVNIVPGSARNGIRLRQGKVPLAVLTTTAGEYGLEAEFDATSIDPISVRFGTAEEVWAGLGAAESHGRGHVEDAPELDESTFDGDDDMVLHFSPGDTWLQIGDTRACVGGLWTDPAGTAHSFFGCDHVMVRR